MPSSWPLLTELIELESTPSTSDHARSLVEADALSPRAPFAVRARRQTRGRGRGSHRWWSDAGSLAVTLVLDPAALALRVDHEPRLALATAVALIEAVERVAAPRVPLGIRWPNDVEAAGRKVAGILPERVETSSGARLLVGLGVNVTTDLALGPPEVARMAASIASLSTRGPVDADEILAAWLDALRGVVPRLAGDDPALSDRWSALDALRDLPVRVKLGDRIVMGRGRGIGADGALRLATADRGELSLLGGQVLRDPTDG